MSTRRICATPCLQQLVGLFCLLAPSVVGAGQLPAVSAGVVEPHQMVLDRYCVACHNDRRLVAGLSLETLDLERVGQDGTTSEVWEKVVRKLRTRAMPPPGRPRPDGSVYDAFSDYLATRLDGAATADPNPGRRPAVHRLNRAEYVNAVRDLLALDIDGPSLLPADDSGYGFDNIADVLSVSPMLTERYLAAARMVSRLAVGDPSLQPTTDTFPVSKYLRQDTRVSEDLPFGSRGGLAVRHYFPVDADYVVRVNLLRTYDGRVRGLLEPTELEVRLDGALVETLTIGAPVLDDDGEPARRDFRNAEDDGQEIRFTAKAGPGVLAVSFVDTAAVAEGMLRPHYPVTSYEYAGDQTVEPGIANIELRGPYAVTGRGDTPSRRRVFTCRTVEESAERACASEILSTVARRAYRRPVTDSDREILLGFYDAGRDGAEGDFDRGIEMALRRVLISPDFLFRSERDPADVEPGAVYAVSDLELASRLSFFLWSSIPDDELLDLAEREQLRDPATLERQVRRMLSDQRARALVDNFAGQWLYSRNMPLVTPDPYAFPDFDDNLRQAMQREMELFVESQVREDHGVLELLTADYTFVNERLARHYGIPNIYGNHFRRLTLTGPHTTRRGLLGKASLLTVTSYPHRTSPVVRGKWLLENILGAPPPPPPADVPALDENEGAEAPRSVRERLEQHRANPVCASCHQAMDPLGFALENFDGIGRWRAVSEAGTPIDASGVLVDGTPVDGPASLREALLERPDDFVTTVTEKLLTYALGRGIEYYDAPAIRQIVARAAADGYRWSTLVRAIAESTPFQMRRTHTP